MGKYAIGVDIGGTTVKIGMFDKDGNKLDCWEIPTRTENNGSEILPDVAASLKEKIKENDWKKADIIGIGIGVPGPVQSDGVVLRAVNLGWGVFNVKAIMEDLMDGIRCEAGNDANVAALGEMWKGGGRGFDDVVLVTLGTGIGGGIICKGNLLVGATGAGGEIGHLHLEDGEKEACNCGQHGCFEEYASATGAVRVAKRILEASKEDSVLRGKEFTCKDIFDAAKAGDPVAKKAADKYGYYLGKGLGMVASVVNPEIFVLGGGVAKAGDYLIELLKPSFANTVFPGASECKFAMAMLGNDAGMYGAAKLVL